jgi:hypothetical protein
MSLIYIKERCLFVNETQILFSNFQYLTNSDKLYWLLNNEDPKIYMGISTFLVDLMKFCNIIPKQL